MVLNIFYHLLVRATPVHARRGGSSLSPKLPGHRNCLFWAGLLLFSQFVQTEPFPFFPLWFFFFFLKKGLNIPDVTYK